MPIDFSPGVQPINLPGPSFQSDRQSPQRTDLQSQVNGPVCLISGYGTIRFQGSTPDMLQQATVPLVTRKRFISLEIRIVRISHLTGRTDFENQDKIAMCPRLWKYFTITSMRRFHRKWRNRFLQWRLWWSNVMLHR